MNKGYRLAGKWDVIVKPGDELKALTKMCQELEQDSTLAPEERAVMLTVLNLAHCTTPLDKEDFQEFLGDRGLLGPQAFN